MLTNYLGNDQISSNTMNLSPNKNFRYLFIFNFLGFRPHQSSEGNFTYSPASVVAYPHATKIMMGRSFNYRLHFKFEFKLLSIEKKRFFSGKHF